MLESRNQVKHAWLLLVFVSLAACGDPGTLGRSVVSPTDVTARVALSDVPVLGADVTVDRNDETTIKGELLAASDHDAVILLPTGGLQRVGIDDVRRFVIKRYDNGLPVAVLATWSVLGAVGGLTHGLLAIASEWVWAGFSAGAIVPVASDQGRFAYTDRASRKGSRLSSRRASTSRISVRAT
jgi:hypothetical protein